MLKQHSRKSFCPFLLCVKFQPTSRANRGKNINRMIRRQFPKGTDFDKVTAAEVKRVETWLNDYPREILGFMSSAEAFKIAFDRAA